MAPLAEHGVFSKVHGDLSEVVRWDGVFSWVHGIFSWVNGVFSWVDGVFPVVADVLSWGGSAFTEWMAQLLPCPAKFPKSGLL